MMNQFALFVLAAVAALPCYASNSAFSTVEFGGFVRIALPKSWTYLDENITNHLNTTSEAIGHMAGVPIKQGDNTILVAANAYDSSGKTRATVRLSVRMTKSPTQEDVREFSKWSQQKIEKTLMPVAIETVKSMTGVSGVASYKIRGIKVDQNNSLFCMVYSFEGDHESSPVMSSIWTCPMGDRTLKLTMTYEKRFESIYRPTVEYIWRSLVIQKINPEASLGFHPLTGN